MESLDSRVLICRSDLKVLLEELEKIVAKKSDISIATDYSMLSNKSSIEGIELIGNKTLEQLGIQPKIAEVLDDGVAIEAPVIVPEVVAKEVKAENLYTNSEVDNMLNAKVNIQQGVENVGKSMVVDSDGNLVPKLVSSSGESIDSITNDEIDKLF